MYREDRRAAQSCCVPVYNASNHDYEAETVSDDYRDIIKRATLDEATFIQLTLKGKISADLPWRLVTVRPIMLKSGRHLQVSHFDAKQDITKNYAAGDAAARLDELLALPFHSLSLRSTVEDLNVQITKKGKAILHRSIPEHAQQPDLSHDAAKAQPIPADQPDPFLQQIGLMTSDGRIKAEMQDKFAQINEFIKLLEHTGALEEIERRPLRILDCGCGSAHLSFALYHYLNHLRGIAAALDGVDVNARLMEKGNLHSQALGAGDICFYPSTIRDYQPAEAPDIVLALHACDTATDEALALGIRSGAALIMAVPCCHHHLNEQLQSHAPFQPVLRHGILKERLADILTDSFRALILRMMGYKTDVIEFISNEHTGRNLLIRAVRRGGSTADFAQEYAALKAFWGVTPYLETLLIADGQWSSIKELHQL